MHSSNLILNLMYSLFCRRLISTRRHPLISVKDAASSLNKYKFIDCTWKTQPSVYPIKYAAKSFQKDVIGVLNYIVPDKNFEKYINVPSDKQVAFLNTGISVKYDRFIPFFTVSLLGICTI